MYNYDMTEALPPALKAIEQQYLELLEDQQILLGISTETGFFSSR